MSASWCLFSVSDDLKKSSGETQMANQKKNHIYYARYTKWTGKKANEVTDMQAAFALHIFQSDYES